MSTKSLSRSHVLSLDAGVNSEITGTNANTSPIFMALERHQDRQVAQGHQVSLNLPLILQASVDIVVVILGWWPLKKIQTFTLITGTVLFMVMVLGEGSLY